MFRTLFFLTLIVLAAEAARGSKSRRNQAEVEPLDCKDPDNKYTDACLDVTCSKMNEKMKSSNQCGTLCRRSHNREKSVCACNSSENLSAAWCKGLHMTKF